MSELSHKRLVDGLMDAYVSWREACLEVSDAYGSWVSDTGPGVTSAYGRYMAALDHEERASEVYAELVRRAEKLSWNAHSAPEALGGRAGGDGWR
jgi:hypothetical protein